jgi:hypothetical protein
VTDMRDDLRELLKRRAGNVPAHRRVPPSLMGRARRRVALNALGVGVAILLAVGGTFAGLHAFGTAPANRLGGNPSSPSVQPTTPASAVSACTSGQLRAVGSMEGAAGSREGGVRFTNFSDTTCTLQGTPTITLLDGNLEPITTGVTFSSSPPGWEANASPQPAGWPVVTVHPGDSAFVRIRWGNWCPQGRAAPLWRINIPGGGYVNAYGMEAVPPPPCNGAGLPSTIEVGPFEPGTGQ